MTTGERMTLAESGGPSHPRNDVRVLAYAASGERQRTTLGQWIEFVIAAGVILAFVLLALFLLAACLAAVFQA